MESFLYIPRELIPGLRYTCFVDRGRILYGGRVLHKGDCFGIDMPLDGRWRRQQTGMAANFASTLGISHNSLKAVLLEFDDDAWLVKKAATWLALQREIRHLAEQAHKRGIKKASLSELHRAVYPGQEHRFGGHVELPDELQKAVEAL